MEDIQVDRSCRSRRFQRVRFIHIGFAHCTRQQEADQFHALRKYAFVKIKMRRMVGVSKISAEYNDSGQSAVFGDGIGKVCGVLARAKIMVGQDHGKDVSDRVDLVCPDQEFAGVDPGTRRSP